MRSGAEVRLTSVDRANAQTLTLVDTVVSVVQAQVNEATQQEGQAWASQPGVVRTFDSDGELVRAYKLYSAATLTTDSIGALKTDDLPPSDWDAKGGIWTNLNAPFESTGGRRYPILDPRVANDASLVEGFSISSQQSDAPMPVRWLYVLENGALVAPQGNGALLSIPGSENSPVVGRVAFWTDDESCKVNINTAGNGTYWDVPRACSVEEGKLGNSQPFVNEFQRYPGHPATTSLQAVFPDISGRSILEKLTPRYRWGGSEEGTKSIDSDNPIMSLRDATDRVYSSVDELMFAADRTSGILGKDAVERRRFLLTTHSRAPEFNLFNLPRIAIWPIHGIDTSVYRTEIDQEIAKAATINGHPYYFQREDALDPSKDFANTRNRTLYSYLENLTARSIPGFGGGTFATKYPSGEVQQILTEVFDYIRTANLFDAVLSASGGKTFTPGRMGNQLLPQIGHGEASPLRHPNGTMGFGRFYTISEAGLHFIATADAVNVDSNDPAINLTLEAGTPLQPNERRIQAAFLIELFCPSAGWTILRPGMEVAVSGLENIRVNGQSIFPSSADGSTQINAVQRTLIGSRASGGNPGVRYPLYLKYSQARGRIAADPAPSDSYASWAFPYPFISDFFTVNSSVPMQVELVGDLRITISAVDTANPALKYQVQTIDIPAHGARLTKVPSLASDSSWWTFSRNPALVGGPGGRLEGISQVSNNYTSPGRANARWFAPNDVVVSWMPTHGDYRMLAAKASVPAATSPFAPHPSWNADNSFATAFYDYTPAYLPSFAPALSGFYSGGKYRSAVSYGADALPDYPPGAGDIATGDWDRGAPNMLDGPYINKPDEGSIVGAAAPTWYGEYAYFNDTSSAPQDKDGSFFSPTRQMPSPGVFGSLPTGVARGIPWQTLLFRPQVGHPGWNEPRDHLIMDLFWMPVVEPYVISEPFSTAGKVNMNFEILPFTYITRSTGLYAALRGEKIAAIPTSDGSRYASREKSPLNTANYRLDIDVPQTLQQFTDRFADNNIFRSASEICDLWIVPKNESLSVMTAFWDNHQLTADNLRERIYSTLYPRLTTQSNSFTVHMKVQSLKVPIGVPRGQWNESKGIVTGEYQGSALIERYVDPNNEQIPDYASDPSAQPGISNFFRWRTVNQVRFAP